MPRGKDKPRWNPTERNLFWAVREGRIEKIEEHLRLGLDVNKQDRMLFTPLMIATESSGIVRLLLKHGANPNLRNDIGQTAFMIACKSGSIDSMRLLKEHGADVHAKDMNQMGAAAWTTSFEDLPEVLSQLATWKVEIDSRDVTGHTPLSRCALMGHIRSASVLIQLGANTTETFDGKSLEQLAVERGNLKLAELFRTNR